MDHEQVSKSFHVGQQHWALCTERQGGQLLETAHWRGTYWSQKGESRSWWQLKIHRDRTAMSTHTCMMVRSAVRWLTPHQVGKNVCQIKNFSPNKGMFFKYVKFISQKSLYGNKIYSVKWLSRLKFSHSFNHWGHKSTSRNYILRFIDICVCINIF